MCADSDVSIVRDWLKKQKHLPQDVEDHYIQSFIVATKGSVQKAKTCYERFHMMRHAFSAFNLNFDLLSPEKITSTRNLAFAKLPKKSPEGYTIIMTKRLTSSPGDEEAGIQFIIQFYVYILVQLWDNAMDDCQVIIVNDWEGVSFTNCKSLTPTVIKQLSLGLMGGLPLRIKSTHDANVHPILEWVLNAIKPLLSEKNNKRRFAHSKLSTLVEHIPKDDLPSDYGGKAPSMALLYEITLKQFEKYRDRMQAQKAQVLAEKPFVPASFNIEDSNTFKKLDID